MRAVHGDEDLTTIFSWREFKKVLGYRFEAAWDRIDRLAGARATVSDNICSTTGSNDFLSTRSSVKVDD